MWNRIKTFISHDNRHVIAIAWILAGAILFWGFQVGRHREAKVDQPVEVQNPRPSEPLFRAPTATEAFHLNGECDKLARQFFHEEQKRFQLSEGDTNYYPDHLPRLEENYASHYSPRTNRCYVKITVIPHSIIGRATISGKAGEDVDRLMKEGYSHETVFDGQTEEKLAEAFWAKNKPIVPIAATWNSWPEEGYYTALSHINQLMSQ